MAVVSRKEFALMCGYDEPKAINVYVGRGKIILVDPLAKRNSKIDTENVVNKMFMEKAILRNKKPKPIPKPKDEPSIEAEDTKVDYTSTEYGSTKKETAAEKRKRAASNKRSSQSVDWDLRKKKADTIKAEKQAELETLKLEKMAGNLLPIDVVDRIFSVYTTSVYSILQNDLENIGSLYTSILAGGDRKYLSEIMDAISDKIDDAVKRSGEVVSSSIDSAINEYSETRNRGERK